MKFLLTGGAGFIGSHLSESLLSRGNEVTVIDDLSTGQMRNIEHLKGHKSFRYVLDTIMNRSAMAELVDNADTVLHLAAAVGVRLVVERPVHTIETNIKGTEVVLEFAAKKQKRVFIFSTSEVYGKSTAASFSEADDLILGPTHKNRWGYAASKIIDEFLALAYLKEKGVPTTIIRLFNTVGPRQTGRYGMVIPRFVRQAMSGEPITVFGNGKQIRTFTHVKDAVAAIMSLVETDKSIGEVFNVGGNEQISIEGLASLVKERMNSKSEIQYIPYDQAYEEGFEDMEKRVPNTAKLRDLVGFSPRHSLDDIIRDVADYFRQTGLA